MSLTDIMSGANLSLFPILGMVLFLGAFVLVAYRALTLGKGEDVDSLSRLALEDDDTSGVPTRGTDASGGQDR